MDNSLAISLPYIDNRTLDGLTDTYIHNQPLQQEIIQLIENEMKNMKQQNYLKHLPLNINIKQGILFNKNPIVQRRGIHRASQQNNIHFNMNIVNTFKRCIRTLKRVLYLETGVYNRITVFTKTLKRCF